MSGPWAYENHELVEHLRNTSDIAEKFANGAYRYTVVKRLKVASNGKLKNMSEAKVLNLIRIVALLHDIGKAADQYQSQFSKDDGEVSFYLHEFPSAFIAYNLMKGARYEDPEKVLVTLSILHFHEAMRTSKKIHESKIRTWSFEKWFPKMKPVFDACGIEEDVWNSLSKNLRISDIENLNENIEKYAKRIENKEWVKLYCLFLAPAVIGDIKDSSKFRPKDQHPSKFRRELLEVCL